MSYRIKNQQQNQQQQQQTMNFQQPPAAVNAGPKTALPIQPGYGGGKAPLYPSLPSQQQATGSAPPPASAPPAVNPQWSGNPSAPPQQSFQQQQPPQQPYGGGYGQNPSYQQQQPPFQQPPQQQQQQQYGGAAPRVGETATAFPTQMGQQQQPPQQQMGGAAPGQAASSWQNRPRAQFFADMKGGLTRDYILIVDKSGSMSGPRWQAARNGIAMIAPEICKCDPDGATVYFFSSYGKVSKYEHVRDSNMVMQLFDREVPSGTTDLAGVLTQAMNDHFNPQRMVPGYSPGHGPTTILVITDGEPDDKGEVMNLLVQAANCLEKDEELSVSFIQVGEDDAAMQFLKLLDDGLVQRGARFDIVDAISSDKMHGIGFDQLIWYSIND